MLEQGHSVTLFCHDKVDRVPEGVEICDAREITGNRSIVMHLRNPDGQLNRSFSSPSLFADLFRYHMIEQLGMIWLDLDCFLLKHIPPPPRDYFFGWQDGGFITNAILQLPKSSPTLKDLIAFCENEYPIPPFFSFRWRTKLHLMKAIGKPIHVSRQKWGVWGPRALTYFLTKNGEAKYAMDRRLLCPISPGDVHLVNLPSDEFKELYLKDAMLVHLYGSILNPRIKEMGRTRSPNNSFLSEIIKLGQ